MTRFHDSRFHGVRLVCRLRRGNAPQSASASSGPQGQEPSQILVESEDMPPNVSRDGEEGDTAEVGAEKVKEKYFIVKSLTIEDLELSARNGTWATQAHNEVALNKAYQVCTGSPHLKTCC